MFKSRNSVLALDLGGHSIKAVELTLDKGRVRILRAGVEALPRNGALDKEDPGVYVRETTLALANLLARLGIVPAKCKRIISCLPTSQISIKQIKSLPLTEGEIQTSLLFEARKHLPVEGDVLMDYQVVGKDPKELDILLVVSTKQAVVAHVALLEGCGLKAGLIDAPPLALANAWLLQSGAEKEGTSVFINIGAGVSNLCFCRPGGGFLSRDIAVGGDKFTEEIKERCKVDYARAEAIKKEKGILHEEGDDTEGDQGGMELEIDSRNRNVSLQTLVREIQRSVRFYLKESGSAGVERFILSGGGAADAGLKEYLEKELGVTLKLPDPFSLAGDGDNTSVKHLGQVENRYQFAQVMGLGLRGLHEFFPDQLK